MLQHFVSPLKPLTATFLLIVSLFTYQNASGAAPFLAFSDLISGPDTGLGDSRGSGVIVTLWGQNLGASQGDSAVTFTDSAGTVRKPAEIYYWKNADGVTPSGPANLFASHKMQEIAFSIPDSATGAGTIKVTVKGEDSNTLPFTVRPGNIYHVKSTGSDSNDGSFDRPWKTMSQIGNSAPAGSTTYIHDVDTGGNSTERGFYWRNSSSSSNLGSQFAIIAYPDFHPSITAQKAVETYNTDALVVSKFDIYASNYKTVDANDQPSGAVIAAGATYGIESNANGRAVANRIGDIPGGCASKYQGAIVGGANFYDKVSNYKIFGNEVYDYGCAGTSKLHHTTYMSIRSGGKDLEVAPWEFGYNYLHGNKAKFGIHQFDQDSSADDPNTCGTTTGPILIHHNVIIDQASAGISVGSQCGWDMDVYIENNVLINVGLAADWDGINPQTSTTPELGAINIRDSGLLGKMYIRDNLIYKWVTQGITGYVNGCLSFYGSGDNVSVEWVNNICYTELDHPFVAAANTAEQLLSKVNGGSNVWHYSGSSASEALPPAWDKNPILDHPKLVLSGSTISVEDDKSPIIGKALNIDHTGIQIPETDIYGFLGEPSSEIGPVEFLKAPKPPIIDNNL